MRTLVLLGLDPHTVQAAPKRRENRGTAAEQGKESSSIDLTDEYLASCHTAYPDILDLNRMDPSIALGFYCRNRKDFIDLQEALTNPNHSSISSSTSTSKTTTTITTAPKLVSFVDKVPNYMSASASVNDMMLHDLDIDDDNDAFDDPGEQDEFASDDDEDDYVLL